MRARALPLLWLTIAWVALWRDLSLGNVVSGVVIGMAVLWLFPPARRPALAVRPLALLRFLAVSAAAIVRANLVVAWEILTPRNRINAGVVAVELESDNALVITLVSHAISLGPGTVVVDIGDARPAEPTQLYVHVLHLRSVESVRGDVLRLERLALAAVSGRDGRVASAMNSGVRER